MDFFWMGGIPPGSATVRDTNFNKPNIKNTVLNLQFTIHYKS